MFIEKQGIRLADTDNTSQVVFKEWLSVWHAAESDVMDDLPSLASVLPIASGTGRTHKADIYCSTLSQYLRDLRSNISQTLREESRNIAPLLALVRSPKGTWFSTHADAYAWAGLQRTLANVDRELSALDDWLSRSELRPQKSADLVNTELAGPLRADVGMAWSFFLAAVRSVDADAGGISHDEAEALRSLSGLPEHALPFDEDTRTWDAGSSFANAVRALSGGAMKQEAGL